MSKRALTAGWISLMDYASKTGVSLSTLRRHIKSNKILYKVEQGRYLLFYNGSAEAFDDDETEPKPKPVAQKTDETAALMRLDTDLKKAREEIAELKTLIAFYEEQLPKHSLSS